MKNLLVLFAAISLAGCATHGYVSREVGEVNKKLDNVTAEVEKTQAREQRNEVRIDEVDKGVAEAKGSSHQAMTRAEAAEKAAKCKLIYTVTLSNDKVTFPVNRAQVGDDAKKLVDEAIAQLKAENRGVYFE